MNINKASILKVLNVFVVAVVALSFSLYISVVKVDITNADEVQAQCDTSDLLETGIEPYKQMKTAIEETINTNQLSPSQTNVANQKLNDIKLIINAFETKILTCRFADLTESEKNLLVTAGIPAEKLGLAADFQVKMNDVQETILGDDENLDPPADSGFARYSYSTLTEGDDSRDNAAENDCYISGASQQLPSYCNTSKKVVPPFDRTGTPYIGNLYHLNGIAANSRMVIKYKLPQDLARPQIGWSTMSLDEKLINQYQRYDFNSDRFNDLPDGTHIKVGLHVALLGPAGHPDEFANDFEFAINRDNTIAVGFAGSGATFDWYKKNNGNPVQLFSVGDNITVANTVKSEAKKATDNAGILAGVIIGGAALVTIYTVLGGYAGAAESLKLLVKAIIVTLLVFSVVGYALGIYFGYYAADKMIKTLSTNYSKSDLTNMISSSYNIEIDSNSPNHDRPVVNQISFVNNSYIALTPEVHYYDSNNIERIKYYQNPVQIGTSQNYINGLNPKITQPGVPKPQYNSEIWIELTGSVMNSDSVAEPVRYVATQHYSYDNDSDQVAIHALGTNNNGLTVPLQVFDHVTNILLDDINNNRLLGQTLSVAARNFLAEIYSNYGKIFIDQLTSSQTFINQREAAGKLVNNMRKAVGLPTINFNQSPQSLVLTS